MELEKYRKKRKFDSTSEPLGQRNVPVSVSRDRGGSGHDDMDTNTIKRGRRIFVVQKHQARQLHYDFRLEIGGVLKSWAIPKGPSLNSANKRLAKQVEDHPLEYADFEGVIPEGNYGAGVVLIWDKGEWEGEENAEDALKKGKLEFKLKGERLKGGWALIRMKGSLLDWLLIKKKDEWADEGREITEKMTLSVKTGRSLEEIEKEGVSTPPPCHYGS